MSINEGELFRILGNETRFKIVAHLASGEKCVCSIFRQLDLPQNLVSHHLGILRESGLIADRKDGRWVHYSLNEKTLKKMQNILAEIIKAKKEKLCC